MTLDEAIKHCLEVAERNETSAITYKNCKEFKTNMYEKLTAEKAESDCRECAADHRQLAEWLKELKELRELNDKIYDVLAKQFGSPCNYYAVDEYMRKNGSCDDCGIEISDKECWHRYIQIKLIGDENDAK